MELSYAGERIALPRSKKCRALLGYLAVTARPHRRERLCDLFWDVTDDPRGALRWTLSRLRSVLPEAATTLQADRESVSLRTERLHIDAAKLAALRGPALSESSDEQLEAAASLYRGELLEGLELTDFLDFTAWCVAEREELRRVQCGVLHELTRRFVSEPTRALPWARQLVQVDAFDVQAHQSLLSLLLTEGFGDEAKRRYEHAQRQFRQVDAPEAEALERAWRALRAAGIRAIVPGPAGPVAASEPAPPALAAPSAAACADVSTSTPFVGRRGALARAGALLASTRATGAGSALLLTAEPGAGKTRLLERICSQAVSEGFEVLSSRAFDLERGRPFGPWLDALEVAPDRLVETAQSGGRAQLFEQLAQLVRARGAGKSGVILAFDDIQWLDRDSAEALHHLMRGQGGLLALLAARAGELQDNPAVYNVLRGLQRDRRLEELELEPLSPDEVRELVGGSQDLDIERIMRASAGNPLYALELSRGSLDGESGPPPTLVQLVRERVGRLSGAAHDVLRWGAVLGYTFDAVRLESLSELSQMDVVGALEELERHALLRIDITRSQERYAFSHDIVREAAYSELSHPRRRLMHRKVAHLLEAGATDPAIAYEVARHASLAGEVELGIRACVTAGQYALRTCANSDAEALARRGLHHAAELDEPARVAASLDLLHVLYSARSPDHAEATARVRVLAERALDLGLTKSARIGFQMLSFLRWESASMADAHENILQAERVSRSADPDERSQALAHAARCLVLLEKNLGQAEAFMMEASGVSQRSGRAHAAVAFARAMIATHRGEHVEAELAFREAQDLARASGERLAEFGALEHRAMLALDRGSENAEALTESLAELATRVRPGAEVAIAAALLALARVVAGADHEQASRIEALREAGEALRAADAKYELSFVLTRWAKHELERDDLEAAEGVARDALAVARAIGRISEVVIATVILAEVAQRTGRDEEAAVGLESAAQAAESDLSATARALLGRVRSAPKSSSEPCTSP
ncbi:MAG: AAA family ATPase [Myxococcales bacterium]|nr:AAA family ATPase [Myxococcales bacterium]